MNLLDKIPKTNFLIGMAQAFDLFGVLGRERNEAILEVLKEPKKSDYETLASDWKAIGDDLRKVMGIYDN